MKNKKRKKKSLICWQNSIVNEVFLPRFFAIELIPMLCVFFYTKNLLFLYTISNASLFLFSNTNFFPWFNIKFKNNEPEFWDLIEKIWHHEFDWLNPAFDMNKTIKKRVDIVLITKIRFVRSLTLWKLVDYLCNFFGFNWNAFDSTARNEFSLVWWFIRYHEM